MSRALAISPAAETKWTVINGSMAGSVRLMSGASFTIGRSAENEFVIVNDPKCSRKHASVQSGSSGYEISSLNEANPVQVNGREVANAVLKDGDVVTVGNTEVKFNSTNSASADMRSHSNIAVVGQTAAAPTTQPPRRKKHKSQSQSNPGRMVLYTVIALGVLFFLLPNGKKKEALSIRTEQQIKDDIETANKLNEAAQEMSNKRFDDSVTGRQAQSAFVTGFRDYRKGQFERSIESFQSCLALNPRHNNCTRYLRLAQRRFNEVVQYNIVLGRRYRDQNQFKACRSAFRNVMVMVKDANSAAYKEAKANYDACNSLVEGRF